MHIKTTQMLNRRARSVVDFPFLVESVSRQCETVPIRGIQK